VPPDNSGEQADHDRPLILDELGERLQRFHVLAASDEGASDKLLNELGGSGRVEHDMVLELSATRPLAHPERVADAHAVAMHALEVLSRNGDRPPSQLRAGPLTGLARFVVQQFIRYIVRNHQTHVANSMRDLYTRRLGWIPSGDPSRLALVRARLDIERALPAYKKSGGGLPTFLVGGAAVSSLAQVMRGAGGALVGSTAGVIAAGVGTFVLLAGAAWAILRGAAIARRRIRLTMDRPLAALWETIGWCGRPPRDSARAFALIAILITAVGWILIPLGTVLFTVL
jgi:hypothetical protein